VRIVIFGALASITATLPLVAAYNNGPIPGRTGGFDGPTCHACHQDNELNAPGGQVTLNGVPERYTPATPYRITVKLERSGLEAGGFSIAARFESGERRGQQAGDWKTEDAHVVIEEGRVPPGAKPAPRILYPQHATKGTRTATPGEISWSLTWIAPTASAPVQFNVAANASNDDASPLGDFVYLREVRSLPEAPHPASRMKLLFRSDLTR
jgi:hypothetical protein